MISAGTNHSCLILLVAAGLFTAVLPCPSAAQSPAATTGTASALTTTATASISTLTSEPASVDATTATAMATSATAATVPGPAVSTASVTTATAAAAPGSTETASARYFVDEPIKLPAHYQEAPELARLVEQ